MGVDAPIKALLIAISDDAPAAIYAINRLKPDLLCFFVAEPAKALIETAVQPYIVQMPRRWDWLITSHADRFMPSYQALARDLPDLLRTWDVGAGDLVIDLTGATSAMAAAMALAGVPYASRVVMIGRSEAITEGEAIHIDGQARIWTQGNPWDEAATPARRDACDVFNRGAFGTAASLFRHIETRVSGGQKPLYRALADLTDGYALWERFQHRQAWDKLKTSLKALDMASVWGGPAGLKVLLPAMKQNAGFLEKLVLDPHEVKETLAYDLLAHAKRRAETDHHLEAAVMTLLRALEAFAQHRLFKQYRIKSWDVRPEQLPAALQESCRTCYLNDIDGKYKLPLLGQFQTLVGLGDTMGQAYQAQWIKMKPLLDAAGHAVLAHGFEPVKPERFQQLYDMVLKVTGVSDTALPRFPVLNL
jgi:CRISPR-associated protein (TIGR02710 family)